MANRDHSMDDGIIQAAYSEFLAYGFQKASLHKIAEKAGVTTGAIYTRYKNKDALFVSLLQDFFETMKVLFKPVRSAGFLLLGSGCCSSCAPIPSGCVL